MRILFIGHNGYGYPHTRVRCYHFARILRSFPNVETAVLSYRDDLAPHRSEADMYEKLRDRDKLLLTGKAIWRLFRERNSILYIQKAHFHSAAPFWLHRLGFAKKYILDYDDYDIPLSNFFFRGALNRFFFGSHRWDEITYRLARQACGCVAASHELQSLLQEHNPHVAYISTGVDVTQFRFSPHSDTQEEIVVLWNGLVWGEPIVKNLLFLLRAFQEAYRQAPHLRLWMVGGGASWSSLRHIASQQFPDLPVVWNEWVDPREMPNLLNQAHIGVLPLDGNDRWLQCKSPTKLFEYMSSGLTVIASAVGEANHVIEHENSGLLAKSEEEFTQYLILAAQNSTLRNRLGIGARQRIESTYALPVLGERLYHFLHTLFPE